MKKLMLFQLVVIFLIGCKKEDPIVADPYVPNIAPCEISEELLLIDEIIYGPSWKFPNATMRITIVNSTLEFAFNKVPATGMYHLVSKLVGSYGYENQMATVKDSGSFLAYSYVTDYPEVYIENYNNELTISYCDLSNSGSGSFNAAENFYYGNPSEPRKVRMSY